MEYELAESRIDSIRQLVETRLSELIKQQTGIYGEVAHNSGEVLLAGGKRLRPILLLLAYELAGGKDKESIIPLALAFELIHTATLIHDDINDQADKRRGKQTIHDKYGVPKAIISGDWLFTQGFSFGGRYGERVVEIITRSCSGLAAAEYSQLNHVLDLSTSPEDYLEIIIGKTAGPFSCACEVAGIIAGLDEEKCQLLSEFGMELGITFQLVDDILDVKGDERMGKPRGADVYEGKMTLPLIHSLTLLHGEKRQRLAEVIRDFDDEKFEELITLLNHSGSLDYCEILIQNHIERALGKLELFGDSEAKKLLLHVARLVQVRHS
ncbi:MAG: polyprenyl synthetase family protein [Candidatus Poseidoniaceae archaeon]|jgi:geranylgeranyl pyrophosphate synthase|nr:polyprenyl synthetase family protein [Candidatus Poseidoniaceae archaeon]